MNYQFVKINTTNTYSTLIDPSHRPRYICFKDKDASVVFIKYLTNFRSKYGIWPVLDMSKPVDMIKSKVHFKERTPEELEEYISLIDYKYESLYKFSKQTGASFICIHSFDYTDEFGKQKLHITGEELDTDLDLDSYTMYLEKLVLDVA